MAATTKNTRGQRNNPYLLDGLAVTVHRSAAGALWRWRTEIILTAALSLILWRLSQTLTLTGAALLIAGCAGVLLALRWTRRFLSPGCGAWRTGTGCSGCASKPGCTPAPGGSP
jgi:hypothetical protein